MGSGREDAIEVTTDTAAKRGLAPSAEAWAGWLYNGGHAVLCSPQACTSPAAGIVHLMIPCNFKQRKFPCT